MKNRIKILGIVLLLITGFAGCEKNYIEPEMTVQETESISDKEAFRDITNGVWRITSFQWRLRERNDHFINYHFRFRTNGLVVTGSEGVKDAGKWSQRNTIFQLLFDSSPLKELNSNNWRIYKVGANKFVLKGLSPYDHTSQVVEFERL